MLKTKATIPGPADRKKGSLGPFLAFVLGALSMPLAATLLGAWTLQIVRASATEGAGKWLALGAGLLGAWVLPSILAVRFGKKGRATMRVFLGFNLVVLLALLGLASEGSGRALAAHGDWPLQVAGTTSSTWSNAVGTVAGWLGAGEGGVAPVAPSAGDAGEAPPPDAGASVEAAPGDGAPNEPSDGSVPAAVSAEAADAGR